MVKIIYQKVLEDLVFDELCANFFTLSENRKRIKKEKLQKNFINKIKLY